jgi:hypothetical protein
MWRFMSNSCALKNIFIICDTTQRILRTVFKWDAGYGYIRTKSEQCIRTSFSMCKKEKRSYEIFIRKPNIVLKWILNSFSNIQMYLSFSFKLCSNFIKVSCVHVYTSSIYMCVCNACIFSPTRIINDRCVRSLYPLERSGNSHQILRSTNYILTLSAWNVVFTTALKAIR